MSKLIEAMSLADSAHQGQFDKSGNPYISIIQLELWIK